MASSSTAPLLFRLLLICIVLDVVIRNFEKPPARAPTKKDQKEKENKYENPLKDVEIDTSLDEDDDDSFVDKNKKKSRKKSKNETELDDDEIEKEKEYEKKKEKKHKKNKKEKYEDEEYEDEEKNVLTIVYDKKSFQKYFDNLKNQIMGNFTSLNVIDKEYPLPSNKKFFSKFTFFTQMGISLFIFGGSKMKDKLTMIPPAVFDIVEKNKWVIMIGNFLGHQWLNKFLSTTGAFEVYYKNRIIFSKLASNRLPTEADIHKQLRKYIKRKKKSKKTNEDDEEDADEDL